MKKILKDKNGEMRIIWVVLLSLALFIVGNFGTFILFNRLFPSNKTLTFGCYALSVSLIFVFSTKFIAKAAFNKERTDFIDLNFKKRTINKFAKGLLFGFLFSILWIFVGFILEQFDITYNGFDSEVFIVSFLCYLGVGIAEECTFRGLIDTTFSKYGPFVGIFASALIFAYIHNGFEEGIYVFIERVAMGVLFSLLMRQTNSLMMVIGAHTFYDFSLTAIIGLDDGKRPLFTTLYSDKTTLGLSSTDVASLLLTISALTVSLIIFIMMKKKKQALSHQSR